MQLLSLFGKIWKQARLQGKQARIQVVIASFQPALKMPWKGVCLQEAARSLHIPLNYPPGLTSSGLSCSPQLLNPSKGRLCPSWNPSANPPTSDCPPPPVSGHLTQISDSAQHRILLLMVPDSSCILGGTTWKSVSLRSFLVPDKAVCEEQDFFSFRMLSGSRGGGCVCRRGGGGILKRYPN